MPVTLHVEGTPRRIPTSLDRSAFRIVQEALRNVHRHANGEPASVRVIWRDDALGVGVRNTGGPPEAGNDGRGLTVMRERAEFSGGELRAGALPSGGYEVTAQCPSKCRFARIPVGYRSDNYEQSSRARLGGPGSRS